MTLKGPLLNIGRSPVRWSTAVAQREFLSFVDRSVVHYPDVYRAAREAVGGLGLSYACLHYRRGDFSALGWNRGVDAAAAAAVVAKHLLQGEALYLATDEEDEQALTPLLAIGAQRWADVSHRVESALPFEDYVGLIEQHVCANARIFIGTDCSSFTGGIFNLR